MLLVVLVVTLLFGPVVCWAVTAETLRGRVVGAAILLARPNRQGAHRLRLRPDRRLLPRNRTRRPGDGGLGADQGCSDGSTNECLRRFTIVGTGTPEEVSARVREHLKNTYDCAFPFGPSSASHDNSWSGDCAMHGWGLDQFRTGSRVWVEQDHVMVSLIYKDDW